MPNPSPRDVTPYRQPMVTSLGIIMGFLLNFLANWAINETGTSALHSKADWEVFGTLILALVLMFLVLYRLLDPRVPEDEALSNYVISFKLYMAAIALAFLGLGLGLFL